MIFESKVLKPTRHGELEPYFTVRAARFNVEMGGVFPFLLRLVFSEPLVCVRSVLTRQSQWHVLGAAHSVNKQNQLT